MPAVSGVSLALAPNFMGTISLFRQWDVDIGDAGITAASLSLAA